MTISQRIANQQSFIQKLAKKHLGNHCKICGTSENLYIRGKTTLFLICKGCLKGAKHHRLRELAVKHLGGKCVSCGSINELHIHHINGDWQDIKVENAVLLCDYCHGAVHCSEISPVYTEEQKQKVEFAINNFLRNNHA